MRAAFAAEASCDRRSEDDLPRRLPAAILVALLCVAALPAYGQAIPVTVRCDRECGLISRHIYGHFAEHLGACVYDGLWVGEDSSIPNTGGVRSDVVAALRTLRIPNLRWPGGCFADDYHWRDGIGPRHLRPKSVNLFWGQGVEANAFGTHEFFDLCEKLGAEPYLAGNVGTGTPQELRDWIEYITFDGDSTLANQRRANGRLRPWTLKYVGVGNESWGCGGDMRPEYYADLFRRYASFCKGFGGNALVRVACGPSGFDRNWNRVVIGRSYEQMQGYSVHYYTLGAPWDDKLPSTGFGEAEWVRVLRDALRVRSVIQDAQSELDAVDPQKRIGLFLDEWGTWYESAPGPEGAMLHQQNTLRDALVAALTLHILHEHNGRIAMANIAQTVNVLQAMILTDGPKMVLTPTYHAFEMMRAHQDAVRVQVDFESPDYVHGGEAMPAVSVSASRGDTGVITLSVVNAHARESQRLALAFVGADAQAVSGRVLTAERLDAHNTFDEPSALSPVECAADVVDGRVTVEAPARSLSVFTVVVHQP